MKYDEDKEEKETAEKKLKRRIENRRRRNGRDKTKHTQTDKNTLVSEHINQQQ